MGALGNFIKSAITVLPEVKKPTRKPSLTERLIWTAIALGIYLTMSQIPLYGIVTDPNKDTLAYTRIIFASAQGSLMELGIGPIVTAGLIMQLLKGSDLLKFDLTKPDQRAMFTASTKFLTMVVILVEGLAYTVGGAFGPSLPTHILGTILVQLFAASVVVMLLDELVQKGWGLGSGISLFILAGVAQTVIWDIFSPLEAGDGMFGIAPFAIGAGMQGKIGDAFFRQSGLPSLFSLAMTVAIILIIIYAEGIRVEIPITSTRFRGFSGVYPIKLLSTSNIPVILVSALLANVTFFSQLFWSRFNSDNSNQFLSVLATYNSTDPGRVTGGLVYYITNPGTLDQVSAAPLRALTYVVFVTLMAILFARIWIEIGGLSSKAVAKNLLDAKVQVPGFRRADTSVESILDKYISTLTTLSGLFIGLLAASSDLLGAFGTGTGLLLMVSIILQYYQILVRERFEEMMPRLAGVLGEG